MSKIAAVFPGQGAQYIGMAKDFYENFASCREVFKQASEASGLDVAALCFEENEQIHITEYTQIAMITAELAILTAACEKGFAADAAAGLSLGEYGALAVSKVMDPKDIFRLVRKRGIIMQEAVPVGGAMTAVLGLAADIMEQICEEIPGQVSIANYNCPGQLVITGEKSAVEQAGEKMLQAGAKRCIPLRVSGPFHSPMLEEAGKKLGEELGQVLLKELEVPYYSNVTGNCVKDQGDVKELLQKQVASPVKWQQCVEQMIADGVDTFVEIGPGKTLSSFIRKIDKSVKVLNLEKVTDLEKLSELDG